MGQEPGAQPPFGQTLQRMLHFSACDDHICTRGHGHLGCLDFRDHAAAGEIGSRVSSHSFDLRRDLRYHRHQFRV